MRAQLSNSGRSKSENRRQSELPLRFNLAAVTKHFPKRFSTSSANLSREKPLPEQVNSGKQLSASTPPPPRATSSQLPRRPMAERHVSRRFRSDLQSIVQNESFHTKKKMPLGYIQIREQFSRTSVNLPHGSTINEVGNKLSLVMLEGLKKPYLCDVEMVGKDGVTIRAPSFLLCSHSKVLEQVLIFSESASSKETGFVDAKDTLTDEEETYIHADRKTVRVPFASEDAIQVALHFMASHEFPHGRTEDSSEENLRTLTQVNIFAKCYKMTFLAEEVYRVVRVLVNKTSQLASVVFDECNESIILAGLDDDPKRNELMTYVFEAMREKPGEFLIEDGLRFLRPGSIQKIISDHEIDVDEITMFHILFTWVKEGPGKREDKLSVAKALVSNIQLSLMDSKYLNSRVRHCGFVDESAVNEAIKEIEDHLANLSPEDQEHVLVMGAGTVAVNGIYVRMEEDIGLGDEEAVFIKEASEDQNDGDYGLYLWKDSWAISPCVDYSNVLYSRHAENSRGWDRLKPPVENWKAESGKSPVPTCQWKAGISEEGDDANYVAPRLSVTLNTFDMATIKQSVSDVTNGDHADTKEFSLDDMLHLPTDQNFEDGDYRDVRPRLLRSDPSSQRK